MLDAVLKNCYQCIVLLYEFAFMEQKEGMDGYKGRLDAVLGKLLYQCIVCFMKLGLGLHKWETNGYNSVSNTLQYRCVKSIHCDSEIDLRESVLEQCLVEFGNKGVWLGVGDRIY
jgi:hypothetical protein